MYYYFHLLTLCSRFATSNTSPAGLTLPDRAYTCRIEIPAAAAVIIFVHSAAGTFEYVMVNEEPALLKDLYLPIPRQHFL
jgi:hypothetical protein